jgi:serine/threonine protein kinase
MTSRTADSLTAALADRYRIECELGQGGMATVYLAHDLKHERKVAVKVLKRELAVPRTEEPIVCDAATFLSNVVPDRYRVKRALGMPSFARDISSDQVRLIQAFVLDQARIANVARSPDVSSGRTVAC